jgi:hypothetical protein
MKESEHRKKHIELHNNLDELIDDAIRYGGLLPSQTTILDLMRWSHDQTIKPSSIEKGQEVHTKDRYN